MGVSDKASGGGFLGLRGNALVMTYTETVGQGVLFLTSTFWSLYVLDLGASVTFLGVLAFIPGVVRTFIQAPTGYISDRYGRKRLVVWGGFIASFAPFAYYLAPNWLLLVPGVILEAFTNAVLPARQAMFAAAVEPEKRATAFAAIHTFFSAAASIMPIVGGFLLERMGLTAGMKVAFLFTGVMMLAASLGRAMFLKEDIIQGDAPGVDGFSFGRVLRDMFEPVAKNRGLKAAIAGSFLFSLTVGILTRYNVVYAVGVIGLSKVEWGLVAGALGVVGIFTRIPIGRMVDRLGRRMSILVSYAVRPLCILAFAFSGGFLQVLFAQLLDNIFGYIQQPALEAFVIDVTPPSKIGRAYGAMSMIPGIALTVAPLLGAFIWEALGAAWAFYAAAGFSASAALVVWFFLKEAKGGDNPG